MTLKIACCAVCLAAPLGAQPKPLERADTVAIKNAAAAFSRPEKVLSAGRLRVVGDTAWTSVYNPDSVAVAYGGTAGARTIAHVIKPRAIRVERRAGQWVAIGVDPKVEP